MGHQAPQHFKPSHRQRRMIRIYLAAARIGISYLWFGILARLRGPSWREAHRVQVHLRNARRAERVVLEVKGLFVKIGQLLSILTNFLPESFRAGLEGVQDQVPARPFEEIAARIHQEFGVPHQDRFATIEETPIASASLAQVHKAVLHDGTAVAVKVQHLEIEHIAEIDLRTFRRLLKIAGFFVRLRGLDHIYQQIQQMIREELDFTQEARHLQTIAANFEGHPHFAFPVLFEAYSSNRILTTSLEAGIKISDVEAMKQAGISPETVASRALDAYCQMLFQHGVYHADPHPGNLLVRDDGTLVFLDFGAVGHLSPAMKDGIPRFLEAVLRRDTGVVFQVMQDMGFVRLRSDDHTGHRIIQYFQRRCFEQVPLDAFRLGDMQFDVQTKMDVLADLRELRISMHDLMATFQIPKEWILLHRTLLLLLGLVSHVDPNLKPMPTIRPYLSDAVRRGDLDWKQMLTGVIRDLFLAAFTLPQDFKRVLSKLEQGGLPLQIEGYQHRTRLFYALGQQWLFGALAMGSGYLAYGAWQQQDTTIAGIAWKAALFFTACLGGAMVLARKWRP